MGLDVYLKRGPRCRADEECRSETVEEPSARYPDHFFKIGCFRSSYNEGGINSVLCQHSLPDLYAIVEPGDDYIVTPDWPAVLARSDAALDAFDAAVERMRFRAFHGVRIYDGARNAEEALARYREELKKGSSFEAWSNGYGIYYPKGLTIYAVIPGPNYIGQAGVWIVAGRDAESIAWYRHALEIVRETAEWVLAQPDPKAFHLHWSA